jgi:hypothetical protein
VRPSSTQRCPISLQGKGQSAVAEVAEHISQRDFMVVPEEYQDIRISPHSSLRRLATFPFPDSRTTDEEGRWSALAMRALAHNGISMIEWAQNAGPTRDGPTLDGHSIPYIVEYVQAILIQHYCFYISLPSANNFSSILNVKHCLVRTVEVFDQSWIELCLSL